MTDPIYVPTVTGKLINLRRITVRDINLDDIAIPLANTSRYFGQCLRPMSVAEHAVRLSVVCGNLLDRDQARVALLHDGAEAYLGEIVRPLKHSDAFGEYRLLEAQVQTVVFRRFLGDSFAINNRLFELDAAFPRIEVADSRLFPNFPCEPGRVCDSGDPADLQVIRDAMAAGYGPAANLGVWGWPYWFARDMFNSMAEYLDIR